VPLVLKTRASLFDALCKMVKAMHPYQVPGIAATELTFIDGSYAEWLNAETSEPD
jgi:periplasmic divalent cation tolerance protein